MQGSVSKRWSHSSPSLRLQRKYCFNCLRAVISNQNFEFRLYCDVCNTYFHGVKWRIDQNHRSFGGYLYLEADGSLGGSVTLCVILFILLGILGFFYQLLPTPISDEKRIRVFIGTMFIGMMSLIGFPLAWMVYSLLKKFTRFNV